MVTGSIFTQGYIVFLDHNMTLVYVDMIIFCYIRTYYVLWSRVSMVTGTFDVSYCSII